MILFFMATCAIRQAALSIRGITLLEMLAEKYSMDISALMNVYMKGLLDAVSEKGGKNTLCSD